MSIKTNKIGILTGGGDCAGLNAAVKWIVKTALDDRLEKERGVKYEVVGIRDGWEGLVLPLDKNYEDTEYICFLTESYVRTWDRFGGTNLGSSRTNPYSTKDDRRQLVFDNIERLGLDAIVAIGGDDTLGVAGKLSLDGITTVGIPKTIDKDLAGTDYTLGFETALNVITEEIDRLRTFAGSHKRIFVVETMGRHAGWLALEGGEASGAYIILIPEYDFSIEKVCQLLVEGLEHGNRYNIVVVSEGAKPMGGKVITRAVFAPDEFGDVFLGGSGEYVAREVENITGLGTRSLALSYLQRGGAPCAFDRRMGRYFGIAAVDLLSTGQTGRMVSYREGKITSVPLEDVIGKTSIVDIDTQYDKERYNGRRTIVRD
jgi:6-phosphofructokinase 1